MKKHCLSLVVFLNLIFLFHSSANAQLPLVKKPGIALGGNLIYSMPKEQFKNDYNFGVGGEVYGGVGWGSTYIIATIGVAGYKAQPGNSAGTLTSVPVKIGLKKYFLLKKLFIDGDAGTSTIRVNGAGKSVFTAGFGGGVRLLGLEAALYYDAFKNTNSAGYSNSVNVKIGWGFSL